MYQASAETKEGIRQARSSPREGEELYNEKCEMGECIAAKEWTGHRRKPVQLEATQLSSVYRVWDPCPTHWGVAAPEKTYLLDRH